MPPPVLIVGRFGAIDDDAIAVDVIGEGLTVNTDLATDALRRSSAHGAADDEEVPVNSSGRAERDVGVDGEHATRDVTGDGHRALLHGYVAGDLPALVEIE